MLVLSCIIPSVSTVEENEVDHETAYQDYMNDWYIQIDSFSTANERDCSVSGNENSSFGLPIMSIVCSIGGPMDSAWPM